MSHDNKHCLYRQNSALRSFILPSITLCTIRKKHTSSVIVEVLSVSLVHTTSAAQFRLHHLQMKSWKYVRW